MNEFIDKAIETGGNIFNRTVNRLRGARIGKNQELYNARAEWTGRHSKGKDWRVRLTLPTDSMLREYFFSASGNLYDGVAPGGSNKLLAPLADAGGFHWPLTPTMVIQHTANYNALAMTHSNYPFQAYQNSQVDQLNIIGEFPVQNQEDARYWVATVNFLRAMTKMFFGQKDLTPNFKGNPPPIMTLNGYGDHMFKNVPVVINTFNVELRSGTDYISTNDGTYGTGVSGVPDSVTKGLGMSDEMPATWAPALSNISVLVTPIYSRETVKKFNMRDFANGKLNGADNGIGFI
jgi:hypothetical protein